MFECRRMYMHQKLPTFLTWSHSYSSLMGTSPTTINSSHSWIILVIWQQLNSELKKSSRRKSFDMKLSETMWSQQNLYSGAPLLTRTNSMQQLVALVKLKELKNNRTSPCMRKSSIGIITLFVPKGEMEGYRPSRRLHVKNTPSSVWCAGESTDSLYKLISLLLRRLSCRIVSIR